MLFLNWPYLRQSPKIKQNFVTLRHCQLSSLHYELASVKSGIALRLSEPKEFFFFVYTTLPLIIFSHQQVDPRDFEAISRGKKCSPA